MTHIRAVLLDADGVVQVTAPAWRASLAALCQDPARVEEFLGEVFAAERPCTTGAVDFADTLAPVLQRWQVRASVADALRIWTLIEPSADVLALVERLRSAGVTVALATNQQAHRARFMSATLGYAERFDHLLYSCDLGHAKPSPQYFAAALSRLAIDPAQALFIDDAEANVAAARAYGLNAEVYHVSEGTERIRALLNGHGLDLG